MATVTNPGSSSPAVSPLRAGLGVVGAVAGGTIGHLAFGWLVHQGFYALALPGALLGLGYAVFARQRNVPAAVICGVMAVVLGLFSEWRYVPFVADHSLGYFLAHLHQLRPWTLLMVAIGGVLGFWFALRGTSGKGRLA